MFKWLFGEPEPEDCDPMEVDEARMSHYVTDFKIEKSEVNTPKVKEAPKTKEPEPPITHDTWWDRISKG